MFTQSLCLSFLLLSTLLATDFAEARSHHGAPRATNRSVAEDKTQCEKTAIDRVMAVEISGEPKFSTVNFDLEHAEVIDAEMPDMTGDPRRRRSKRHQQEKIATPQMGRKIVLEGSATEKAGSQKVTARCLIYKGKVFTATFELAAGEKPAAKN